MSRSMWLALNFVLIAVTVGAGWLAINAGEAARPSLSEVEMVRLPSESPPLPPAPYRPRAAQDAEGVARRRLFAEDALGAPGAALFEWASPTARGVLPPPAAPSALDLRAPPDLTMADPSPSLRMAVSLERPRHGQFFGGHQIPESARRSDVADLGDQADGLAPAYAFRPDPNPRRGEAAPAESIVQGGDGDAGVEEAATAFADPEQFEEDGLVLLGVLTGRGEDRALIRTPDGEAIRVSPGDEVAGWRVSEISDDQIQLRRATQTRILRLPEEVR